MTKNGLNKEYYEWMYRLVCNSKYSGNLSYRKLLKHLYGIEFIYIVGMDANRAADGIDLRYRFGYEHEYDTSSIAVYLDDRRCSVLEMLLALSIRCEENIMDNPDAGNRTGQWFWGMIDNLGLRSMDDTNYDPNHINNVISKFLYREYQPNGEGGLFTINNCCKDLRKVEIWYQMCWYLDGIL